jgi:hypothetical protein
LQKGVDARVERGIARVHRGDRADTDRRAVSRGAAQCQTRATGDHQIDDENIRGTPAPATDWTELVPLGPVKTPRATLTGAAASLPTRVGGNTGLYDTALAAFEDMSAHYDPASVNVVALLIDGADLDPDSVGLPALLSRLKAGYNPSKPVHIVTIGFGADADASALKQISDATQGQSYLVTDPNEILGVLLDSIIANH